MRKLYCVGELLIDFQSVGTASLKDTKQFVKNAGGAPANVCVQAAKLGQSAVYLSKVGKDGFGDFLIETLQKEGVDTSFVSQTGEYDTSLAFVSFQAGGEREFSFYRRTAADLHFTPQDFEDVRFAAGDALEFGSVALKTEDAQNAHRYLIGKAKKAGALVCFDPNLRFNLWESGEALRSAVMAFAPYADVLKLGKDELGFLTGGTDEKAELSMFTGTLKVLLITDGKRGAKLRLADGRVYSCGMHPANTVDTTGAGDSFFGAFLAELLASGASQEDFFGARDFEKMLLFANRCGAYTTAGYGAIPAMGTREQIEKAG